MGEGDWGAGLGRPQGDRREYKIINRKMEVERMGLIHVGLGREPEKVFEMWHKNRSS